MGGLGEDKILGIARAHVDGHVHAGLAGVDHLRLDFDEAADQYRLVKTDSADVYRHAVVPAPTYRTGVARLIDPAHHTPAVHLAAEIHIDRLCKKAEGHIASLRIHRGPLVASRRHNAPR